jgi:taurine dehydrogenase small subunit
MEAAEVAALIRRYDDAWNAHDLDAIDGLHARDVVFENHSAGEHAAGAEAVRAHIGEIFRNWPDLTFRERSLRAGADFAVCEWTASATASDGRRVEWDGVDVFPLRDGLIERKDVYSAFARHRVVG